MIPTGSYPRSQILSLFRSMAKEIHKSQTGSPSSGQYLAHLKQSFKKNPATVENLREAREYLLLLSSIREQQELFVRYNIGAALDQRELIKKSSERVGLRLPSFP